MSYIVLDLEWNQAVSSHLKIFSKLPIPLRGEIIEIGAVRLNEDYSPGEEFQIYVKPVFFKCMHSKVQKLTQIPRSVLTEACGFKEAFERFRAWCGDDCTFLTWGYDDRGIFEENIIVHNLDWDWIRQWMNVQLIYSAQESPEEDRSQKALLTAMEHFSIEPSRPFHDALGDAYHTAQVCQHLDLDDGFRRYDEIVLRYRSKKKLAAAPPAYLSQQDFDGITVPSKWRRTKTARSVVCPECGNKMKLGEWKRRSSGKKYMALARCSEHGTFFVTLNFHPAPKDSQSESAAAAEVSESEGKSVENPFGNKLWRASRYIYRADVQMIARCSRKYSRHKKRKAGNTTDVSAEPEA